MMATSPRGKGRVFMLLGLFSLIAGSITLTRFHLDFVSGFAYAFGTGALIVSILSMRQRKRYAHD